MSQIGLVGPGNLGRTLAISLPAQTWPLGPVMSSSKVSGRRAVREMRRGYAVTSWEEFAETPVILLAAPAGALAELLAGAAERLPDLPSKQLLIAGVADHDCRAVIARMLSRRASIGGLLPVAVYRRPSFVAPGASFAGWGPASARRAARSIVKAMGGQYTTIGPDGDVQVALGLGAAAGLLSTGFELAVRRLVAAGFRRQQAIEALSKLPDICLQEHRRARLGPPAPWLPAHCAEWLRAVDGAEAALYAKALEMGAKDLR